MYATGNTDGEGYLLAQLRQKYPENPSLALYEAEKLAQNQDWESVTKILADFAQASPETMYLYTTALCRLKTIRQHNVILTVSLYKTQQHIGNWQLK